MGIPVLAAEHGLIGLDYRVLELVEFDKEDESPFVGLLKVEAA